MITIDDWHKTKLDILKAKGEARNIMKRAPLDTFVLLVKADLAGKLMAPDEWGKMYERYKRTGRIK